jgi:hypothetical protein
MGVTAPSHPPAQPDHPHAAAVPMGTAITDVFAYLPYVYRVIENLGAIQAFVGKLMPYFTLIKNDAPELINEGKAILNTIAPNLLAGMAAQAVPFDVAWVQRALNKANNAGLEVDGKYGDLTHEAVGAYQTARGLTPDTWAGTLTIAKLFKEVGANP